MSNRTIFLALRVLLGALALFFGYRIYRIIMEPIEFEDIRQERYSAIQLRLSQLREVEKLFKSNQGLDSLTGKPCSDLRDINSQYTSNIDELIAFVKTGSVELFEEINTSKMVYDEVYQTEMLKDECVLRTLGKTQALDWLIKNKPDLFTEDFNPDSLKYIPYSNKKLFTIDTASINDGKMHVFKISAPDSLFFHDVYSTYEPFIRRLPISELSVGSLEGPQLNGNWE